MIELTPIPQLMAILPFASFLVFVALLGLAIGLPR